MTLIKNGLVLDSKKKEFINQDVLIENGKIKDIGNINIDCEIIDATDKYVIPSFIDIHTHGAMGVDFLNATSDNSKELLNHYLNHATKTIYATTVTASESEILTAIKNIKEISKYSKINIEGIHVEGPFISKDAPGCHKVSEIRLPTTPLITPRAPEQAEIIRPTSKTALGFNVIPVFLNISTIPPAI